MTDWQSIVDLHAGGVWRTAYRLVGNDADAADCMQEAFVSALEISRTQRVRSWPALLTRIVTHKSLDALRRRMRHGSHHEAPPDWNQVDGRRPGPVDLVAAAELSERLRCSLAALSPAQAEVFCLRFVSELSYKDIARQLGMTKSAVGVQLHRARRRLRELLSPSETNVTSEDVEVSP